MPGDDHARPAAVLLVGGHESAGGRTLPPPEVLRTPGGPVGHVTAAGRDLERALGAALRTREPGRPVVVVPMTLGRDPRLVSDTARTVRWAARHAGPGALALAPPFGTADHLVSHLRAACRRLGDDGAAVLLCAPAADPFDDAELYRVAALVRTHAPHAIVEVGLRPPDGGLEDGLERCRRLGATRVAVVPAEFGVPAGARGPLLSAPAAAVVVAARVATALDRLVRRGDDGVAAAHDADHQHGFAHSHGEDDHGGAPGHSHAHDGHAHGPAAGHAHDGHAHGPAAGHDHDGHAHGPAASHAHDGHAHPQAAAHPHDQAPTPDPHADDHLAVG